MRWWFSTLLVAVISIVHFALSARIKAPVKRTLSSERERRYLEQHGTQNRKPQKVQFGKSFEELQQFSKEAFPDEEELQKNSEEAFPDVVNVSGLDFNTDITVITKGLRGFGKNLVQKALARIPSKWQEAISLYGFGSGNYWHGGWVMGCPDEGATELKRDYLFISSVDREDDKSMTMVPRQWWLQKGSGLDPPAMYRPKEYPNQKAVKAVRRGTKSWTLFGKQPNLCLWTGQEVVILNDTSAQCWSHKISIEESQSIVDLCK